MVSRETVVRVVAESITSLGDARVGEFVPVLAYRFSRERLLAIGQAESAVAKPVPEVLFVCVQNAGRSQIAAGVLKHLAGGRVSVRTAGSAPAAEISSEAAELLASRGIDVGEEFPKPLTDEVVRAADVVVTMGCGDACPVYPGKLYEDWDVGDPAGADPARVRAIADELETRVRDLLRRLG
ncbi:MAG TPA: hypothetical protein VM184_02370 [Gaiellaceae bacterium]|nr:hypothetical protein [Gaiellaceae bacterium]